MDFKTIKAELSKPFAPEDLEWRLQGTNKAKTGGFAVPYVTNRAIMDRLDDVVGPENWRNEFRPWHGNGKKDAQICGISIYSEEHQEWIIKYDGAEDTDIEAVKGGLSDSMKRAAVHWGIGRVLYKMDTVWVDIEQRGNSYAIAAKDRAKLDKAYLDMLKKLRLEPAQPGGLQSQLTPSREYILPGGTTPPQNGGQQMPQQQNTQARQQTPSAGAQQQNPQRQPSGSVGGNIMTMPAVHQPAWEYKVISVNVQNGMSGATTSLILRGHDGKDIRAYRRGAAPDLTPGTELCQVTLSMQKQDSVVFYVLNAYQVMGPTNQAA